MSRTNSANGHEGGILSEYNPFSLSGKAILITGASSGIGQATAVSCSRLGAKVVVCARDSGRLEETLNLLSGSGHSKIVAELSNLDGLKDVVDEMPAVDGLVLCAGRGLTLPFLFGVKVKYDEIFNINFHSPVELLRLAVKKKKLNPNSSVVFVSSIGGNKVFSVGNAIYGASKAAINSTMKFCAKELALKKIRVNSVNPGMTMTKLINRGTLTEEQFKADMERYPLKRYGEPDDIANGIVYLLSNASSWVTGHALVIDGGVSI